MHAVVRAAAVVPCQVVEWRVEHESIELFIGHPVREDASELGAPLWLVEVGRGLTHAPHRIVARTGRLRAHPAVCEAVPRVASLLIKVWRLVDGTRAFGGPAEPAGGRLNRQRVEAMGLHVAHGLLECGRARPEIARVEIGDDLAVGLERYAHG